MSDRRRKSMGRDPFDDASESRPSRTVEKLIRGPSPLAPEVKKIDVTVALTPVALKHLDQIRALLTARGRDVSRDELIRIAIMLLGPDDVP